MIMDRRIIHWGLAGLLMTSVAVGATVSPKTTESPRSSKKSAPTAQAAQPIHWISDLKQAHRLSEITGRPILIVFSGPGDKHCQKLDREILSHPTIIKYVNTTFVPVRLDALKDARAVEILGVKSVPTTIILSPEADLLGTIEGYVPIKEYATVLKKSLDYRKTLKTEQVAVKSEK
jgi:thioredoxin-related protein